MSIFKIGEAEGVIVLAGVGKLIDGAVDVLKSCSEFIGAGVQVLHAVEENIKDRSWHIRPVTDRHHPDVIKNWERENAKKIIAKEMAETAEFEARIAEAELKKSRTGQRGAQPQLQPRRPQQAPKLSQPAQTSQPASRDVRDKMVEVRPSKQDRTQKQNTAPLAQKIKGIEQISIDPSLAAEPPPEVEQQAEGQSAGG